MDERLNNFRYAYHTLAQRVQTTLTVHIGDIGGLQRLHNDIVSLRDAAVRVCQLVF
jgi:hypothetical protein